MPSVQFGRMRIPVSRVSTLTAIAADLTVTTRRFAAAARTDRPKLHRLERQFAARLLGRLEVQLDIAGQEHIQPDVSYLVVSMHESLMDPAIVQHLPIDLRFLARQDLLDEPLIGHYLRSTGQLLVTPEQGWRGMRHVLRSAIEVGAAGESLVLFPQGSVLGLEIDFRNGLAWLAAKLGWPILPVVLTGGHQIWEHPFAPTVRFGQPVSVRVLEPIPADQLDIQVLQRRMKAVAVSDGMAPVRRFDPDVDGWWDGYAYTVDPDYADLFDRVARHRASVTVATSD